MIFPIRGGGVNFDPKKEIKRTVPKSGSGNPSTEGVVLEIQSLEVEDKPASQKVERLKKLIKEGRYPLKPERVAEKLIDFLTDVG